MTMNSLFKITFAVSAILLVSACSPSTRANKRVSYCETKYNPIKLKGKEIAEKIDLKPGDEVPLEVGTYEYQGSQIFYNDPVNKIRIHFTETVRKDGSLSSSINCLGGTGVNLKMEPVSFSIPITSAVIIGGDNASLIEEKIFSFDFRRRSTDPWMTWSFGGEKAEKKSGTFRGRYEEYPKSEQIFASLKKPNMYQYRVHLDAPNASGTKDSVVNVQILVSLKRIIEKEIDTADIE